MGLSAISLFSGAGGLDLAARRCGIRTICYVEWDPYAQGVLMSRIRDGGLDDAPIWSDVTTFDGKPWRGKVDIVFGGFPCQPHSVAGKRAGAADERNLWPDTMRILRECGAWGFVGENVPGILTNGYAAEVLADLERAGFCGTPFSNTACAAGAPHMRERVFFLAHSKYSGMAFGRGIAGIGTKREGRDRIPGACPPRSSKQDQQMVEARRTAAASFWDGEPGFPRVVNGLDKEMDRARCTGNGVVPEEAEPAFRKLLSWAGV